MNFEWISIPRRAVAEWNRKLMGTGAVLYQYPFWLEALRQPILSPHYYYCAGPGGEAVGYAAVIAIGIPGFRIGVMNGGPVVMGGEALPDEAYASLWRRLRNSGFVCIRFANLFESAFQAVCGTCQTDQADPFPWYAATDHALVIDQSGDDDAVLAHFKTQARAKIKKAAAFHYRIEASDSPAAVRAAWPVVEAMEARKGRQLYRRRRESYERLLELVRPYGYARVYTTWLDEKIVQVVLIVRDRDLAHYVLGALDVPSLNEAPSPACLVHWKAMREFAKEGVRHYSLGNDNEGPLRDFKHKFRPSRLDFQPIRTAVLKPALYRIWKSVISRLTGGGSGAT